MSDDETNAVNPHGHLLTDIVGNVKQDKFIAANFMGLSYEAVMAVESIVGRTGRGPGFDWCLFKMRDPMTFEQLYTDDAGLPLSVTYPDGRVVNDKKSLREYARERYESDKEDPIFSNIVLRRDVSTKATIWSSIQGEDISLVFVFGHGDTTGAGAIKEDDVFVLNISHSGEDTEEYRKTLEFCREINKRNERLGLPRPPQIRDDRNFSTDPVPLRGEIKRGLVAKPMQAFCQFLNTSPSDLTFFMEGQQTGLQIVEQNNTKTQQSIVRLLHDTPLPSEFQATEAKREEIEAWTRSAVAGDFSMMDGETWDLAVNLVVAFFERTRGDDARVQFPYTLRDFCDWRGIDPRNRTSDFYRQVHDRLTLLSDEKRVRLLCRTELHLPDAHGKMKKTPVITKGAFVSRGDAFWIQAQGRLPYDDDLPDGYMVTLGSWAYAYVEARAVIGQYARKLSEYNLQKERWERQMGWYLVFNFYNQKNQVKSVGKVKTLKPQQPLKMRTILDKSVPSWEATQKTNAGRVISQFLSTLDNLSRDRIIGGYRCLDGAADGSDLPQRGRLEAMLDRRFEILPGKLIADNLIGKVEVLHERRAAGQRAAKRRSESAGL